jgi:hypothetical protein
MITFYRTQISRLTPDRKMVVELQNTPSGNLINLKLGEFNTTKNCKFVGKLMIQQRQKYS